MLCRGTFDGQKIGKNLQMSLPPKKEKANIWKYGEVFLCIFTFVNTYFCTFLHSLWSECICALIAVPPNSLFMLISFHLFADVYNITQKQGILLFWMSLGGQCWGVICPFCVPRRSVILSLWPCYYIICRNKRFSLGYGYL